MKRKLKSPTISLDLCVYLGVEPSCLCMRWPVWERLKSGCICAQSLSHQIFQARILEQAAISFSGESSLPRTKPMSPVSPQLAGGFFTTKPSGKPLIWLLLGHFWGSWKTEPSERQGSRHREGSWQAVLAASDAPVPNTCLPEPGLSLAQSVSSSLLLRSTRVSN